MSLNTTSKSSVPLFMVYTIKKVNRHDKMKEVICTVCNQHGICRIYKGHMKNSGSKSKQFTYNTGDKRDMGSIPGWRKSPGNLLQYPCPENSMDREVWRVTWGSKESDMIKRLSAAQQDTQQNIPSGLSNMRNLNDAKGFLDTEIQKYSCTRLNAN